MSKLRGKEQRFISHVEQFMERVGIFPKSQDCRAFVAASAGRDSMALLYILSRIRKSRNNFDLSVLHVNHGTRVENEFEHEFVRKRCLELDLPFHSVNLQNKLAGVSGDFEASARKLRYEFFNSHLKSGDILYTAHHVDDSFEWSLLQQFKSGSLQPTLGIPVVNGQVARPFMSVTRANINNLIDECRIGYCEDPTNKDINFDRNYIRQVVIPQISKRFPSYLRNYVTRSNSLAVLLGKSLLIDRDCRDCISVCGERVDNFVNITGGADFYSVEAKLVESIISRSNVERGELREQVKKLLEASLAFKRGPLSFSGNVNVHIMPGHLAIFNRKDEDLFLQRDALLYEKIKGLKSDDLKKFALSMNLNQFEKFYQQFWHSAVTEDFPMWILILDLVPRDGRIPSQKRVHPLWPQTTNELLRMSISFQSMVNFFRCWKKARSLHKRSLLFVPIWFIT